VIRLWFIKIGRVGPGLHYLSQVGDASTLRLSAFLQAVKL
jgi:hypothetical protein